MTIVCILCQNINLLKVLYFIIESIKRYGVGHKTQLDSLKRLMPSLTYNEKKNQFVSSVREIDIFIRRETVLVSNMVITRLILMKLINEKKSICGTYTNPHISYYDVLNS